MSYRPDTPFDNIESAEQFVELLIEAINESRRDVDADIVLVKGNRSVRSKKALQLVSANLAKLSQYMTASRRILNHLRTLRRLLLQEQRHDNTLQTRDSNRELSRWP
jgi:predicted ATP-grasp superfamily ATP-dependent carboligase